MIEQILSGIIGGLAYSLSGLAKTESKDTFDWKKMAPTVVIGIVIGGIAGFLNQDYGIVANSSLAAGLTAVIENGFKAIYRKFIK